MYFSISLLVFLLLCTSKCLGQAVGKRADGGLCIVTGHKAILLNNYVFILGGQWTFQNGDTQAYESELYWLDLTTTFAVDGAITPNTLRSVDIPNSCPHKDGGAFFAGHDTIYLYAALASEKRYDWMYAYNMTSRYWQQAYVDGGSLNTLNRASALSAVAPESDLSFFLGGRDVEVEGMMEFNAANPHKLEWRNVTESQAENSVDVPRISGGGMEYVRMGKKGVLVAFGGYNITTPSNTSSVGWDLMPMDTIYVYDIDSSSWFEVKATGDIPDMKTAFCTAVSSSPDDTSFQIHMYGGRNTLNDTAYEDVHVLTVPSFRWVEIKTSGAKDSDSHNGGRHDHKCVMFNETEMVVLGGTYRDDDGAKTDCNSDYPPIKVLDTSSYTWQTQFEPHAEYSVPEVITAVVGGDKTGKATLMAPENGWPNDQLQSIFSQTVTRDKSKEPNIQEDDELPPEPQDDEDEKKEKSTNTGAIAGGVVGGVVGVALIALYIWFLLRRRRKAAEKKRQEEEEEAKRQVREAAPLATERLAPKYWVEELHGEPVQQKTAELYGQEKSRPVFELHGESNASSPNSPNDEVDNRL